MAQKIKTDDAAKKWDIAFTTFPTVSVNARQNDYVFVAKMLPNAPQLNYVLFVRKDSPIQSTEDLPQSTKIALGELDNELLFLFPVYDLYGTALTADVGNIPPAILKKVMTGQVDIGAGLAQIFEARPMLKQRFRVIQEGRAIPTSGLYLSPEYKAYHETLTEAILSLPTEVQKGAIYAAGTEPDYQYMEGVVRRSQEVISCREWNPDTLELTRFYCNENDSVSPGADLPRPPESGIVGRIEGYKGRSNGDIEYKLQSVRPPGEIYALVVKRWLPIQTRRFGLRR